LGWAGDPNTGIGDRDADLVCAGVDAHVDVTDSVWVGVADGVSEGLAQGESDRSEQLAVDDASPGKCVDGGVSGVGQRFGSRGPSPIENPWRHQRGDTLLLVLGGLRL